MDAIFSRERWIDIRDIAGLVTQRAMAPEAVLLSWFNQNNPVHIPVSVKNSYHPYVFCYVAVVHAAAPSIDLNELQHNRPYFESK